MSDIIDVFGESIDKILEENEVRLVITFPEGSMDPVIESTFPKAGPTLDFYLMLHGLSKVVSNLMALGIVDPDKEEVMIDGMLQMVKDEILQERQQDEE